MPFLFPQRIEKKNREYELYSNESMTSDDSGSNSSTVKIGKANKMKINTKPISPEKSEIFFPFNLLTVFILYLNFCYFQKLAN